MSDNMVKKETEARQIVELLRSHPNKALIEVATLSFALGLLAGITSEKGPAA